MSLLSILLWNFQHKQVPILKCVHVSYSSHLLMCECWSEHPDGRPTFSDLVSTISERLEGLAGYMDFSPTWSSGDKTKVSRYDHLLPAQTKENHKGYDHLNPTVVVTDEESVHVTPDNSSTDM